MLSRKLALLPHFFVILWLGAGLIAVDPSQIIHNEMDYRTFHTASRFLILGNIGVMLVGGPLLVSLCRKVRQVIALVPLLACSVYIAMLFFCSYPEARWSSSVSTKFAIGELIFAFVLLLVDVIVVGISAYLYRFFRFLRQSQTGRSQKKPPYGKQRF